MCLYFPIDDYEVAEASVPMKTELNQAILCDEVLAPCVIQKNPTGKSIAQSYVNALNHLVPAGK